MFTIKLLAKIETREGNPYILVTSLLAQQLKPNWRKPMPVIIQVNGEPEIPWHINMMPVGDGSFYLYLHGDVRKASKTKVGDNVEVTIAFDEKYHNGPMHPIPASFQHALDTDMEVRIAWIALPPSRQKEILRYFSFSKTEITLERNIQKAVLMLSGIKGRFMARDWN